jgi:hypothetical protein
VGSVISMMAPASVLAPSIAAWMVLKSQPEAHTVSVAGRGVGVGGMGVWVGGIGVTVGVGVTVGGMGVSVGGSVSVGGGEVAVGGTGVAVGDRLVPQPLTVRTSKIAVKNNGKRFFTSFLPPPLSYTPAMSGFLLENPKAFHGIPARIVN